MPPVTVVPLLPPQPTSMTLRQGAEGWEAYVTGVLPSERAGSRRPGSAAAAASGARRPARRPPPPHPSLGTRVSVRNS